MSFNLQRYLFAQQQPLYQQLLSLRPQMAIVAQKVYDDWQPVGEDGDPELSSGGICDQIAQAISGVVCSLPDVELTDGGQEGDDHAYIIAYNAQEAYAVDIPHQLYERGGGYVWTKVEGVQFVPQHVEIIQLDRAEFQFD